MKHKQENISQALTRKTVLSNYEKKTKHWFQTSEFSKKKKVVLVLLW